MTAANETHDSACSLLEYAVEEPINGDTDFYTRGAFDLHQDAQAFADKLNTEAPGAPFPYRMTHIGTRNRRP